jgi:hypothetical protein
MTAAAQTPQCPICRGLASAQFTVASFDIHRCGTCEFLFVSPYPGPDVLSAYYNTQYRQTTDD